MISTILRAKSYDGTVVEPETKSGAVPFVHGAWSSVGISPGAMVQMSEKLKPM